jgi:serine/threonine-protein kinase
MTEWVQGIDAAVAAAQRRRDRSAMLALCVSIAETYAALHERGVVHGDVHARNILIAEKPMLIDFGYSRQTSQRSRVGRAGVQFFYEPEFLAARRNATRVPATPSGEQYSIAALLYLLITGQHYLDFSFERAEMERQTQFDPPLPFSARDVAPWPEVEEILGRALEKDPARRYLTTREMAERLRDVREDVTRKAVTTPLSREAHALLEKHLASFTRGGAMFASGFPSRPSASISYGAAGAAVALLQIAKLRGDASLLAFAHIWASRAAAAIADDAWYVDGLVPREKVGEINPYHTESGVHAAAAIVAAAFGDAQSERRAVAAFLRASSKPCDAIDLTLGRCGNLLIASMLLASGDHTALRTFGSKTLRDVWQELDACPRLDRSVKRAYLGMAHGWAGFLYATLRWCVASGDALPPQCVERLHQLAALKNPRGRGASWSITTSNPRTMSGWCNGSAGMVFLYTLAHRILGDNEWLHLAELAAWNNKEEPLTGPTLCCGSAGRAYAFLNLYKHTGDTEWLRRARRCANHAASVPIKRPGALWKGDLGVAVLIADLASPEDARLPFFE